MDIRFFSTFFSFFGFGIKNKKIAQLDGVQNANPAIKSNSTAIRKMERALLGYVVNFLTATRIFFCFQISKFNSICGEFQNDSPNTCS